MKQNCIPHHNFWKILLKLLVKVTIGLASPSTFNAFLMKFSVSAFHLLQPWGLSGVTSKAPLSSLLQPSNHGMRLHTGGEADMSLRKMETRSAAQEKVCCWVVLLWYWYISSILWLTVRKTVTSARIPEEDACHRARNLCVFSLVQKGTPGLTHKVSVLQRVSLDAISDVTVILRMRQSIDSYLGYHFKSFLLWWQTVILIICNGESLNISTFLYL